jgi:hypothetical protein
MSILKGANCVSRYLAHFKVVFKTCKVTIEQAILQDELLMATNVD